MRVFMVLLLLTACKATPAELAAAACDPRSDLEQCDSTSTRRMTCNPTNGQWTPFIECFAPTVCVASLPGADGKATTSCEDGSAAADATSGDLVWVDLGAKPDATGDVPDGHADSAGTDAVQPGQDVADVSPSGVLPNQPCFQNHCATQTLTCLTNSSCIAAIATAYDCMVQAGGGQSAFVQCQDAWTGDSAAYALAACGMLICAGGCGDGVCEANETPTTCPGDCKPVSVGSCAGNCGGKGDDCYCDGLCTNKGDCCADFATACPP